MRLVGGQFKGRALTAPKGRSTRPTSDRARETLFNVLTHASWAPSLEGARVIDLFAGSGALGFEALSRGAGFALFVETDHSARGAIRQNIEALGAFGITQLYRRSAVSLGERPAGLEAPFDIAFLDPPYHKGLVETCLKGLQTGDWLTPDVCLMVETGVDEAPDMSGFDVLDTRSSGAAKLWFLKQA